MSVPSYKRKESSVAFILNFKRLNEQAIEILMRDFGLKARHYTVNLIQQIYGIEPEDFEALKAIMSKYSIDSCDVDKYPSWLISHWRESILQIIKNINIEIELANSIFITNEGEYEERRKHWTRAIGYCYALSGQLNEVIDILRSSVRLNAYSVLFDTLDALIGNLKGVRKSDNRRMRAFQP